MCRRGQGRWRGWDREMGWGVVSKDRTSEPVPRGAHSLEPESWRGSLLVGTATFNSNFSTHVRVSQGRKRPANKAHAGKQPDPQGLSGREEFPHCFDFVTAPACSVLGLTPPFPKQGSLSTPLETSLQSRG